MSQIPVDEDQDEKPSLSIPKGGIEHVEEIIISFEPEEGTNTVTVSDLDVKVCIKPGKPTRIQACPKPGWYINL